MHRRALLLALAVLAAAPAPAHAVLGEATPIGVTGVNLLLRGEAVSSPESGIAYVYTDFGPRSEYSTGESGVPASRTIVAVRRPDGREGRYLLPAVRPEAVRLALREDGGIMAAFDDPATSAIRVLHWAGDGVTNVQTVLADVRTTREGDTTSAAWSMSSDGRGTVVIAAPESGDRRDAVVVAAREPGSQFATPQRLTGPSGVPFSQREVSVGPVAADGAVRVTWEMIDPADGRTTGFESAARAGRGPRSARPSRLRRRRPPVRPATRS